MPYTLSTPAVELNASLSGSRTVYNPSPDVIGKASCWKRELSRWQAITLALLLFGDGCGLSAAECGTIPYKSAISCLPRKNKSTIAATLPVPVITKGSLALSLLFPPVLLTQETDPQQRDSAVYLDVLLEARRWHHTNSRSKVITHNRAVRATITPVSTGRAGRQRRKRSSGRRDTGSTPSGLAPRAGPLLAEKAVGTESAHPTHKPQPRISQQCSPHPASTQPRPSPDPASTQPLLGQQNTKYARLSGASELAGGGEISAN